MSEEIVPTDSVSELVQIVDMFVRLTAQAWSAPDDAQGDTAPSFANKCLGSVYISEIGSAVWKKVMACIENPIELSGLVPDIVRAMFRPDAISATMRIEVFRALTPCTDQKV